MKNEEKEREGRRNKRHKIIIIGVRIRVLKGKKEHRKNCTVIFINVESSRNFLVYIPGVF